MSDDSRVWNKEHVGDIERKDRFWKDRHTHFRKDSRAKYYRKISSHNANSDGEGTNETTAKRFDIHMHA